MVVKGVSASDRFLAELSFAMYITVLGALTVAKERLSKLQKWILVQALELGGEISYSMVSDYQYEFGNWNRDSYWVKRYWYSDSLATIKRTTKLLEEKNLIEIELRRSENKNWIYRKSDFRFTIFKLTEEGKKQAEELYKECLIIYRQPEEPEDED